MEQSATYLGLIPLFPLLGAVVIGLLHVFTCNRKRLPEKFYGLLACVGPVLSFVLALKVFFALKALPPESRFLTHNAFTWFSVGDLHISSGFLADPLSCLMLLFVTLIGTLIHVYSIGYMGGDKNYGKFFAYMNLFLGSMLVLVLGDGPVVMFVGWEGVGLCSYLLISYYSEDRENVLAGNKAFIVNRIGDLGFVLGMAFLFWAVGAQGFDYLSLKANVHHLTPAIALTVCLLLCRRHRQVGTDSALCLVARRHGRSHPVSALIHAATMVTAGVYMVARFSFLYAHVELAGTIVAWVGILTALLAAIFGMFQDDIKKVLAYSTVSQLGYMFAGVGVAAYSAGIFHVFTHAFSRPCSSLAPVRSSTPCTMSRTSGRWADSGPKCRRPTSPWSSAPLALAGCPPFSGFFSKDEILYSALATGHYGIWMIGVLVAGMTAYYTFRMIFVVFHGEPRDHHAYEHAQESPAVMTVPLIILAVGAVFAGFLNFPGVLTISHWLEPSLTEHHHGSALLQVIAIVASIAAFAVGVKIAYGKFGQGAQEPAFKGFADFAYNKFYVDELYNAVFVQPYKAIGTAIWKTIEPNVTDSPVKGAARLYMVLGTAFKALQVGYVRVYAIYMVVGLSLMSLFLSQSLN